MNCAHWEDDSKRFQGRCSNRHSENFNKQTRMTYVCTKHDELGMARDILGMGFEHTAKELPPRT